LDSVDKDKTMLGRDELEVDGMDNGPDLPRSLASTEKVVLDLASDDGHRVAIDQTKVGEEDSHEDGALKKEGKPCEILEISDEVTHIVLGDPNLPPDQLVKANLHDDGLSLISRDLLVEPVVEVVSRGSVVQ
jgi:hypothetical protein